MQLHVIKERGPDEFAAMQQRIKRLNDDHLKILDKYGVV
jgi:hypothetical protein